MMLKLSSQQMKNYVQDNLQMKDIERAMALITYMRLIMRRRNDNRPFYEISFSASF